MSFLRTAAALAIAAVSLSIASSQTTRYTWRYYRPGNTGIQGDYCEALLVGPDGDPWIGGYDPGFEEGGIAKFVQAQNRWINVSNVDYPTIGHPDNTGTARISDIDTDAAGNMWMATGTGGLFYRPSIGPSSLRRFGADNSPIPGGWNRGVEVAPDGTVWFSSYSTVWGSGGLAKYNPANNQWQVFANYGGGPLAVQPRPGGGYYVWTMLGVEAARYDSVTATWTVLPKVNGAPAYLIGNNLTDTMGNTWMYRWTDAAMNEYRLDLRRPDGTWANVAPAPFDIPFNSAKGLRAVGPNQALVVDGGGEVWRFNGTSWSTLGYWQQNTPYSYDIDQDASGNVWVCGIGGAAKRNSATGTWQRYRITNTSQFDSFNNDLTISPLSFNSSGGIYATANAGPGYGGMVRFDGMRWIGFNNHHYGLGIEWPFPTDNSERVYVRPSNGQVIVNPMFNGLHRFDGTNWFDLLVGNDSVKAMVEDSLGRLWVSYYGYLAYQTATGWNQVSTTGAVQLQKDPSRAGTIWAMGDTTIMRTDGTSVFVRTIEDFPELDPQSDQFKGIAVEKGGAVWIGANTINLPDNSALIRLNPTTGVYTIHRKNQGWPFPGEYVMPLAFTADGKLWMQYDSDYLVAQRGLCAWDGIRLKVFPAPPGGEPQWGGLPHAGIVDCEVREMGSSYELWMSCASRGIAVLRVRQEPLN